MCVWYPGVETAGVTGAKLVGSGYSNPDPEPRRPLCTQTLVLVFFFPLIFSLAQNRVEGNQRWNERPYRIRHRGRKGWRGSPIRIHPLRRRQGGFGTCGLLLGRQRLAMGTVESHAARARRPTWGVAQVRVGSMRGHKGLRLRRNRREHALLVKTNAVAAPAILRAFESRAADLGPRLAIGHALHAVFPHAGSPHASRLWPTRTLRRRQ